jgi:methylated-DNA-[protein]-cysteine S-methyltransferase
MTDTTDIELRLRSADLGAPPAFDVAAADDAIDVALTWMDSPIGRLLVVATRRGLLRLVFPNEDHDAVLASIAARVSPRIVEHPARLDRIRGELEEYFTGERRTFEVDLDWSLVGEFGRRVLGACAAVPYGTVTTYARLATEIGSPRAARATGTALGSNPIPIVVPCHRVLRTGGGLGGYAGGLDIKEQLLRLEGVLAL